MLRKSERACAPRSPRLSLACAGLAQPEGPWEIGGAPGPPAISAAMSKTRAGSRLCLFLKEFLENSY